MKLIDQPQNTTLSALATALAGRVQRLDVAAAYVTFSGVRQLFDGTTLRQVDIDRRFLVGIDWFRSEPAALDALANIARTEVRIVDGAFVVKAQHCQPRRSYHPKAYLVSGTSRTLLVGSSNLSKNGLAQSIELSLQTDHASAIAEYDTWFSKVWSKADSWSSIRDEYVLKFQSLRAPMSAATDDDDATDQDIFRIRWVTPETLKLVRSAQNLWVDVGHLHNRDPQKLPGTDLQFSQMTRVFFGCDATLVPGNTPLGDLPLSMSRAKRQVRPFVFNKSSSMDRLSLPVPGRFGWPKSYDDMTLLFTKWRDGTYRVTVASSGDRARWRRKSNAFGFVQEMTTKKREWGVF